MNLHPNNLFQRSGHAGQFLPCPASLTLGEMRKERYCITSADYKGHPLIDTCVDVPFEEDRSYTIKTCQPPYRRAK